LESCPGNPRAAIKGNMKWYALSLEPGNLQRFPLFAAPPPQLVVGQEQIVVCRRWVHDSSLILVNKKAPTGGAGCLVLALLTFLAVGTLRGRRR